MIFAESLGRGRDEDVRRLRLRVQLNALAKGPALTATIVLLNGGVRLACEQDDTAEALQRLGGRGVAVLDCAGLAASVVSPK